MPETEHTSDAPSALAGRVVLGRYRVVRPLARGGMGMVFLGRVEGAAGFAKPVVVKSVLSGFGTEGEGERLFAREARIVSNLQHPGIVAVIDFGKVDASYVMVLEYVHGYHLGHWARFAQQTRSRIPVEQCVHPILCVLEALSFAHGLARTDGTAFGIVHRDVSPANVLIDVQGHVKLSDFGIARTSDDEFRTQQGLFRGTLPYSAPEALQGATPDAKLDQYAAAVVLYQLLSGANPFRGNEAPETIARILNHVPASLVTLRDDVPGAVDAAVLRAMSKDPEQRFPNVAEFARALRAGLTRSERDAADSFARQIETDFAGDKLASEFGLESLAVRDAAWREAQELGGRPVSLSSSPPELRSSELAVVTPAGGDDVATSRGSPRAKTLAPAAAQRSRLPMLLAVTAVLVAAGAVAAGVAFVARPAPEPAPRVLVIEKHDAPVTAVVAAPVPEQPVAAAAVPSAPVSEASGRTPARPKQSAPALASADRAGTLARAFQRQEAKIQSCFQQHTADLKGQTGISVRFQVDETGAVQRAQVSPSGLGATPLGACLVTVARATHFGAQPEPLSFAIPISARVVSR